MEEKRSPDSDRDWEKSLLARQASLESELKKKSRLEDELHEVKKQLAGRGRGRGRRTCTSLLVPIVTDSGDRARKRPRENRKGMDSLTFSCGACGMEVENDYDTVSGQKMAPAEQCYLCECRICGTCLQSRTAGSHCFQCNAFYCSSALKLCQRNKKKFFMCDACGESWCRTCMSTVIRCHDCGSSHCRKCADSLKVFSYPGGRRYSCCAK
eukprot:gb/GEZN01012249.1/.p1 GENE.gb/GEZN01012249.1/~~gb/GEZN01012249.1/.p1  ORF type:complete len:211 (-),score=6.45 gb/GEZN01012249.1/:424-1056(-)